MTKKVAVFTSSPHKFEEIQGVLQLYGCECQQMNPPEDIVFPKSGEPISSNFEKWVSSFSAFDVLLREDTRLLISSGGECTHESALVVCSTASKELLYFFEQIKGVLSSKKDKDDTVYDWDDQFTPFGSQKTLHELKTLKMKVSARQLVVGQWVAQWLHYPVPVVWKHMPTRNHLPEWFADQGLLQGSRFDFFKEMVNRVHEQGAWFKDANSRRDKHYWWPGLNAGLPRTPKKDYIHELTFLAHDITHWAMPDALPVENSTPHRYLYVVSRMLSEAISLVLADMNFIQHLSDEGVAYDFSKRKIHPLYNPQISNKEWAKAVALYAILGKKEKIILLSGSLEKADAFFKKYAPFFEEDIKWTVHNLERIFSHVDAGWRKLYQEVGEKYDLLLPTTQDYLPAWEVAVKGHPDWNNESQSSAFEEDLVLGVLDLMWDKFFEKYQKPSISPEKAETARWILGQLALSYKMNDLPVSLWCREKILKDLEESNSQADLNRVKQSWEHYVDTLRGLNRLSPNDWMLFKHYYPVVPPLYLSYDLDAENYMGIETAFSEAVSKIKACAK